jgi:MazG family protein
MKKTFEELVKIHEVLRGDKGCVWDKQQTLESFKEFILKEAEEVVEAVENSNPEEIKKELGDLFWNILFMCQIAKEKGLFDIKDVMEEVKEKMIRRHPHVFGDEKTKDTEEITRRWHEIKKEEKNNG